MLHDELRAIITEEDVVEYALSRNNVAVLYDGGTFRDAYTYMFFKVYGDAVSRSLGDDIYSYEYFMDFITQLNYDVYTDVYSFNEDDEEVHIILAALNMIRLILILQIRKYDEALKEDDSANILREHIISDYLWASKLLVLSKTIINRIALSDLADYIQHSTEDLDDESPRLI